MAGANKFPESVHLEDKPCPMSCERDDEIVLRGRDRLHDIPGIYNVVRCRSCRLMRTNPRPTPDTIGVYYPSDYQPYLSSKVGSATPSHQKKSWRTSLKTILNLDPKPLPDIPPGRMLEVGCASGAYMHQMAQAGWQVAGIEYSPEAAENAQKLGYEVYCGPVETAPEPAEPYDLITGWMVLEHLHDPAVALKRLHRWSTPGALLMLSVPSADLLEFKLFKDRWFALQLPGHLYHFTPRTLSALLAQNGWQTEKTVWHKNPNNTLLSFKYIAQDRGLHRVADFLESVAYRGRFGRARLLLGLLLGFFKQSGRITVWARRID